MDELNAHIQEEIHLYVLFVDDIALPLMDESRDGVNAKIERLQEVLESKGFKNKSYKDIM